jgi:hypothetical protein
LFNNSIPTAPTNIFCTFNSLKAINGGIAEVRATFDVDVIAGITSYADYATFSKRLRALGFRRFKRRRSFVPLVG